jgi:hypothetical protein
LSKDFHKDEGLRIKDEERRTKDEEENVDAVGK